MPVKATVGDREVKLRAKDKERRTIMNCFGNADLEMLEGREE